MKATDIQNSGPKKRRTAVLARVDADTPDELRRLAKLLGYTYGGKGSLGKLLDAIAAGDVILTKPER